MPAGNRKEGFARYESVGDDYLRERRLKKSAGWILLWALGVGAVISGDFSGWNFGLQHGGFAGLALATLVMALMYITLVASIAELSAALPHAGGFYSFVRNALGPTAGYLCGVSDTIEYVLTPATVAVLIGGYLSSLVPGLPPWIGWLAVYGVFLAVNVRGAELTLRLGLAITILAVGVLALFYVAALASGEFAWGKLWNIPGPPGSTEALLPHGWSGVLAALPFAAWFYLAIEQLPLAAEESRNVVSDMPRALIFGIATLLVLSLLTLVLNTGVGQGAVQMQSSAAPLCDGFTAIFGDGLLTRILTFLALAGLIASFHTIVYAYGRVLFALSRAGYFPRWISVTSRWHTPHRALLVGCVVGLACAFSIESAGEQSNVGAALLNMSVAGAVISYTLVLVSFIVLRIRRPDLARPYRSPLGIPGASLGAGLSLIVLIACFTVEEYRHAMYAVAAILAAAAAYFFLYSRRRLVGRAPEEEAALVASAEAELAHR